MAWSPTQGRRFHGLYLDSQCYIYLSVHCMLTETIFQIDVPQGHGLLSPESDSTNEFPLTAHHPSSQTHKFHRWSMKMHTGRGRMFLFANLDQVTQMHFTLGTGSRFWKKQTMSRVPLGPSKTQAVLAVAPWYPKPANESQDFKDFALGQCEQVCKAAPGALHSCPSPVGSTAQDKHISTKGAKSQPFNQIGVFH